MNEEDDISGLPGVRQRMALYQEECKKKKEVAKETLLVGQLEESKRQVGSFETPLRSIRKSVPSESVRKLNESNVTLLEKFSKDSSSHSKVSPGGDNITPGSPGRPGSKLSAAMNVKNIPVSPHHSKSSQSISNLKQQVHSSSMRQLQRPGASHISPENSDAERGDKNKIGRGLASPFKKSASSSLPSPSPSGSFTGGNVFVSPVRKGGNFVNRNMRLGATEQSTSPSSAPSPRRSWSPKKFPLEPEKSKEEKDKEEKQAKTELAGLLDLTNPNLAPETPVEVGGEQVLIMPFTSVRLRYLSAVQQLKPELVPVTAKGAEKKQHIKKEVIKKDTYTKIKRAWDKYEDAAQDKPNPGDKSEEEKKDEEKVEKMEDEIDSAWVNFAENVVQRIEEDSSDAVKPECF